MEVDMTVDFIGAWRDWRIAGARRYGEWGGDARSTILRFWPSASPAGVVSPLKESLLIERFYMQNTD
jgi:hypothetical protein